MLDDLTELRTFKAIAQSGSLTGAARELGTSLAVVSKRLAALERRAGLRLVQRTTRALSLTGEGVHLLADVERALEAIGDAEARLVSGRDEPVGTLRVTASVSFGRGHVAPVLAGLVAAHAGLDATLNLSDGIVDLVADGFDVAIRIGELADSSATMRKLADNRRILLAAPAYLDRTGRPEGPSDLKRHDFLRYDRAAEPWRLLGPDGASVTISAVPRLRADSGDVVHDWAVAGHGIMVKSEIDVVQELRDGRLERVLPAWHAGSAPVVALFPSARQLPTKTRVLLEALSRHLARDVPG